MKKVDCRNIKVNVNFITEFLEKYNVKLSGREKIWFYFSRREGVNQVCFCLTNLKAKE